MKLTCDARALRGALDLCDQVVPAKTTLAALHHAVLDARADGTLTLTATDLVVRVRATVAAAVEEPGRATLPVNRCAAWLGELDDLGYPVELGLTESELEWRVGPFQLRSRLVDIDGIPDQETAPDVGGLEISAAALASVLPSLLVVATGRDGRIHVHAERSLLGVYAIAPNHAVLAVLGNPSTVDADWCIPARALELLPKEGTLRIGADEREMVLSTDSVEVVARLDRSVKPVPAAMSLASERQLDDDIVVARRDLARFLGAGVLLNGPAVLRYQPRKRLLQVHGIGGDGDDVKAEIIVDDGPRRAQEVTIACDQLQRAARALPGDMLRFSLGNVLSGPGVQLWPADELPDGAVVLHGLRAQASASDAVDAPAAAA